MAGEQERRRGPRRRKQQPEKVNGDKNEVVGGNSLSEFLPIPSDATKNLIRMVICEFQPSHASAPPLSPASERMPPEKLRGPDMIDPHWKILTPLGARAARLLAEQGQLTREEIAAQLDESAGGKLKYTLIIMAEMGILVSRGGYALKVPEGSTWEEYRTAFVAWLDEHDFEDGHDLDDGGDGEENASATNSSDGGD